VSDTPFSIECRGGNDFRRPNAHLNAVPDGGHIFFGHTEEIRSAIAEFLRDNLVELNESQQRQPDITKMRRLQCSGALSDSSYHR
jgi:hypothetical protein